MISSKVSVSRNLDKPLNTICVCGAARSGTSMISGILQLVGVNMGGKYRDETTNEDSRYLAHKGHRELFEHVKTKSEYLDSLADLTAEHNEQALSGWKDPLSSYYISDISNDVNDLGVVVVMRDPVSVALGEIRYRTDDLKEQVDYGTFTGAIKYIEQEYAVLVEFMENFEGRLLTISYEKALLHKELLLNDISNFLGYQFDAEITNNLLAYISPEKNTGTIEEFL